MKHVIVVGVCYLDTILSVPHFPEEDSKLRATSSQVRRGGNCGNTLEVLQQLLRGGGGNSSKAGTVQPQLHLLSPLPDASSPAAAQILNSFQQSGSGGGDDGCSGVGSELCLHRAGVALPASSYIIRSEATGSRTIVNQMPLAEMTEDEFAGAVAAFAAASNSRKAAEDDKSWWHFEGRIPETTLWCIRHLRRVLPSATVSVEVEKPGREGLSELAAEADVVFYSKSWAEASQTFEFPPLPPPPLADHERFEGVVGMHVCGGVASRFFVTWGAEGASAFSTHGQEYRFCAVKDVAAGDYEVVDTIGAGDTFIAGVIFDLFCKDGGDEDEGRDLQDTLRFAVGLATRKVQIDGFGDLGGQAGAGTGAGAGNGVGAGADAGCE
ncbi:hypothetical protein MAPG_07357 [Magnaporthiopsis poae ATCC 64411]|uniref:Carbohydrate kinase PfkB domain-containing protein n=1 Tax=Magnaporthiopsis poae (strain ATCC 64411 / 73-15) TaxID=644358 RepID=A0A0C4E4G3_MAGP6|nr:hypothetical protein MAPG_07357 [Magnaporthiopsis poae ATCC 64411]